MPDQRRHRGPDQADAERFSAHSSERLRQAAVDLHWLLSRGYAIVSSLKIVGDRYRLDARQRQAVGRCSASASAAQRRLEHRVAHELIAEQDIWIDGFNVLTSIESAISGAVILSAQDSTYRDLASIHGTYRKVDETTGAIHWIGKWLADHRVGSCRWLLDAPVSNSGRLKAILLSIAQQQGWNWEVELVPNPDTVLVSASTIVATADSAILDHAERWVNLARAVIEAKVPDAWVIDLSVNQ